MVVGDYINKIKTPFDLFFDLYQPFYQHMDTHKHGNKEIKKLKNFSLITCKLVMRKKSSLTVKT